MGIDGFTVNKWRKRRMRENNQMHCIQADAFDFFVLDSKCFPVSFKSANPLHSKLLQFFFPWTLWLDEERGSDRTTALLSRDHDQMVFDFFVVQQVLHILGGFLFHFELPFLLFWKNTFPWRFHVNTRILILFVMVGSGSSSLIHIQLAVSPKVSLNCRSPKWKAKYLLG